MWILLNSTNVENREQCLWILVRTAFIALLTGLFCGATGPIVKATLQNVNLPNARGQAFALLNIFDDFGSGLGPVFVGMLISTVGGRRVAFNIGVLGWILCGIFNLCLFFTIKVDEEQTRQLFLERHTVTNS